MKLLTIAVDAMGGDHGPDVVVPASLQALATHPDLRLILVGDESLLQKKIRQFRGALSDRLMIQHASQCVAMDESPATALRGKKDSSMRVSINLVKERRAEACVSAGNTGALMATARFVLKTLPGIDRPAIISTFPTITGARVRILDLGANVESTPEYLLQFAVMGSVLVSATENIPSPRVSVLNIGHEDIKGNELVRATSQLLTTTGIVNYTGYIEADHLFRGTTDVVVCDGFVGNVALKTTEGVAILIKNTLKREFNRNIFTKLAGLIALPVLKAVGRFMNPDLYNGATFIGLKGIVVKSHGGASIAAFARALEEARFQAEKNIQQRISDKVEQLLKNTSIGKAD
ncbi:MAG: phosphate acyltransferase PlsX [Gammaproteobacteria bacterium]|nr:phosphate acyltransferase PlsX [Gammaproteobacteria bacterium]